MKKPWAYYDFFYHPYKPVISPRGKFSSDILLYNSLLKSVHQKSFLSIIRKIRDAIGPWSTVWGVKLDHHTVTWELYFYNNRVMDPRKTVTNILKVLNPHFKIPLWGEMDIECQPYFMFSVDLNDNVFKAKQIEGIHLYMDGRPGMCQGNSYYWGKEGMCLENYYNLFQMPQEAKQFIHKVENSAVLGEYGASFLKHDLVRQLIPCYTIGIARKKNKDGVYFSRINIVQLLYFLEHFSYPDYIVNFIRSHQEKLDHLLYDVAFDCTRGPQGLIFGKSSYYSVF